MRPTFALIYFVRHGQTYWNAERRLQGQADTDMTELGRSQADRNGRRLAELVGDPSDFDFVCSPLHRTRETMERVRLGMGLPAAGYRTDARLVEVHFGDWQGHTFAELDATSPGSSTLRAQGKWDFVPPGADSESYAMLLERVRPVIASFTRPTICVTHGGVMRGIFRMFADMPEVEAAELEVPQDRVLRFSEGRLEWL